MVVAQLNHRHNKKAQQTLPFVVLSYYSILIIKCLICIIYTMQDKKDYQERLFIQFLLSDYFPQGNFYRQLKSIVYFSFLYASTAKYYGSEGQKSIDPVVFMKLMLGGFRESKQRSKDYLHF